ncbi:unnamed protein product [Schistosoma rodhaini]|uniref:Tyrosinase_Cu-bd domain-containing protein n=1 Tax=Schistosoma mansoni TaxID=6183 RepID=A0A5K4F5A6_SCHMA|nr:unnamed protein product [Schistosoma rodhaini]
MFILYLNKFIYILLLIDYYVIIVKCLPIHDKQLVINQSLTSMIFHNTTYYNVYNKLMTTNGLKDDLWKDNLTPVIGRVIWCINESKQKWLYLDKYGNQNISTNNNNNNITGKKIILINSGKFYCPQPNQSEDMKYCCGPLGKQICCKITDTPGLRWGIPLGVIVTVIVFLTVSYTIQVFRACDRCYHECPIFTPTPNDAEFQWDTRWYTVSHEGNRYGVTFHSRIFANEFMKCLEAEYGRWNTANILKIQRDGQNFVILNIFFHDLFTPWFYTQGPIKNDEEWIRTDFKNICHTVQARLAVNPRFKWKLNKFPNNSSNKTLRQTNQSSNNTNISDLDQKNIDRLSNPNTVTTPWTPWTKVAYIPSLTETSVKKNLTRNSNKSKYKMKNEYKPNQLVNVIILEDIIECNGLDKGVQTHQKRLQTYKTTIDPVV